MPPGQHSSAGASRGASAPDDFDPLRRDLLGLEKMGSNRFLEIGRRLRLFYEALPDNGNKIKTFNELLEGTKYSRRSASYWIDIDRIYSRLGVPDARLARIGWSKLSMLARHVNRRNVENWLSFAERSTTNEVRARLNQSEPSSRNIVFKLSAAENAILTAALVRNGARAPGPKRLFNKEAALIALCRQYVDGVARAADGAEDLGISEAEDDAGVAAISLEEDDPEEWQPSR